MTITILALLFLALGMYMVGAGIFMLVCKMFKLENVSYKKSLVILLISGIVGIFAKIIFGFMSNNSFSSLFVTIVALIAFHFSLKKFYGTGWKKSLLVYFSYAIGSSFIAAFIIIPFRLFVAQPFFVQGGSMNPTYNDGDYLFISKLEKNHERDEVIIARVPKKESFTIKRIIGLPGELIEIKNGSIMINGKEYKNSYVANIGGEIAVQLREDEYFVIGDNVVQSFDSRSFGPIKKSDIIGSVFFKAWEQKRD